jgi:hypothetical protein
LRLYPHNSVIGYARGVFLVSDSDIFWYRWKIGCIASALVALVTALIAVAISKRFFPEDAGCSVNWCR